MRTYKTKVTLVDSGTLIHILASSDNQAYSGIIQVYADLLRTLCNLYIFRTRDTFRSQVNPENLVYSEPCQTFILERFAKTVNSYNYFWKL